MRPRAVLVMAGGPVGAGLGDPLVAQLGPEGLLALRRVLLRRAVDWATAVRPDAVYVAYEPWPAVREARAGRDSEVHWFAANGAGPDGALANAAVRALSGHDDPLLIVWPELARWRPDHAEAALTDLADGCQVALGPVFDGGFYLLALARPLSGLFGLLTATWRSVDGLGIALAAAQKADIEAGMLRAERALRTPGDVRAALADPLLDDELRGVLEGRGRADVMG